MMEDADISWDTKLTFEEFEKIMKTHSSEMAD